MNTVKLNVSGLKALQEQTVLLTKHHAEVGLFEDTASRSADPGRIDNNPSLGFVHEFGYMKKKIPERSFLLMPLSLHLAPQLASFAGDWFTKNITGSAKRMVKLLGVLGEATVQEAFATGGFGGWPELKARTVQRKGSSAILIESAQMRKAISSRVV